MKILFFTHYFPPEVNAPASRTYDNAKRWVADGHNVTVVTCAPNCPDGVLFGGYKNKLWQKETIDGINVIRVWTFIAPNSGAIKRILNYLSYFFSAIIAGLFIPKHDLLIATSPQFFCGWVGVILKKLKSYEFILEIRDIWPESITTVGAMKKGKIISALEWMERYMYKTADKIVAVGHGYRDRVLEKENIPSKVEVVYNGVDLKQYVKSKPNVDFINKYGLANKTVISYVGTIGMAHGLEIVLETAKKTKDKDWLFLIVGDGARRLELEKKAKSMNLENVIFTGRLAKQDMPKIWSAIDISFIHLKKSDLFTTVIPSKMFEAMAMELPTIMGVNGEARDILEKSESGLYIEPENVDEFILAIETIISSKELREKMALKGRSFVSENFDRDKLAKNFLEIIKKVVKEKK